MMREWGDLAGVMTLPGCWPLFVVEGAPLYVHRARLMEPWDTISGVSTNTQCNIAQKDCEVQYPL